MEADKLVLMEVFALNLETKADRLLQSFFQFPEALGLGVAPLEIGNDADIQAILILCDYRRERVVLHTWSLARKAIFGQGLGPAPFWPSAQNLLFGCPSSRHFEFGGLLKV